MNGGVSGHYSQCSYHPALPVKEEHALLQIQNSSSEALKEEAL